MPDIFVLGLKIGFLALMWLFIVFTGSIIRTDLFGRKVLATEPGVGTPAAARTTRKERRATKNWPKTLTVTHGPQAGTALALGPEITIGRSSDCALILDDDYVSTHHARIVKGAQGYIVEDLGSTNGTYVNNERITAPVPFGPGDTLRIGRTIMTPGK